ncbi:hypothetical protein HJC23_001068 [Cyclotella cryptica]|uniref:Sulfotransferase n=1 Tax=Cyclotella cryptica TaxID=29204 RepID=A0ABD3QJ09_9STRA
MSGPSKKSYRSLVTIVITASCAFLLGRQTKTLELYTTDAFLDANIGIGRFTTDPSSTDSSSTSSLSLVGAQHRLEGEDEADYIIRKSYLHSYAHILPCDNSTIEKNCLLKTQQYFNPTTEQERSSLPSVPWWFQTLLRDIVRNGAYGFWHHFGTTDPAIHFCSIEKVGTTEWRKVFCDLNEEECPNNGGNYPPHCVTGLVGRRCAFMTKKPLPNNAPHAVFLRDPLERLLSAFLDKCVKPAIRRNERHCEPNEVFNPDAKGDPKALPLITNIEESGKQLFAAYLDTMPLKWNVHFVPQAFMCDLYRTIDSKYAFVGDMGKEFMMDLERMANQFGGRLATQLDKSFGYVEGVKAKKFNNTGKQNSHATHAPEKVAKYYTAATVRKGLEYLSIDYVTLGLKVPEWARQMLRDETV